MIHLQTNVSGAFLDFTKVPREQYLDINRCKQLRDSFDVKWVLVPNDISDLDFKRLQKHLEVPVQKDSKGFR